MLVCRPGASCSAPYVHTPRRIRPYSVHSPVTPARISFLVWCKRTAGA